MGQLLRPTLNLGFGVLGTCVLTDYAVLGPSELLWAWSTVQPFPTCSARGLPGLRRQQTGSSF